MPPLIGGDATQQVRMLRPLLRHGLELFSFNYAGHSRSKGRFSLQAALDNCLRILDLASAYSHRQGVPLFGLASCFATLPLLHASRVREEPLRKLVLINAIPRWRLLKIAANFLRYWRRSENWFSSIDHLPVAIRAYIHELLPGVHHRPQAFGLLVRQRVQWARVACELFSHTTLMAESLRQTPVMCVYGRKDRLLHQMGYHDWRQYEVMIQSISPRTQFLPLDGGHFLTCPKVRSSLISEVADFFVSNHGK